MSVGAVLKVSTHGEEHEVVPTMMRNGRGEWDFLPADIPLPESMGQSVAKPQIALTGMIVEEKKVTLELLGFDDSMGGQTAQKLVINVSVKPLMMVLWTGVVLIVAGTAIAFKRRLTANRVS